MERTVVSINAKSKIEAIIALEMALEAVKQYSMSDDSVIERVCVTNEGSLWMGNDIF